LNFYKTCHSFTCKSCCWNDRVFNRELYICEICLLNCFQEAGKIYIYLAYLYLFINNLGKIYYYTKLFLNTRALSQRIKVNMEK